jgi:hypothetical protein
MITFAAKLESELAALRNLSTSAPAKYLPLAGWLSAQFGVDPDRVVPVYLSDLSRQFTARVGASLVSEPLVLVVLGHGDFERENSQGLTCVDRLAQVCAYVGRIQLIIVADGVEGGPWRVRYAIGPHTSEVFAAAQVMLDSVEHVPVIVPPL